MVSQIGWIDFSSFDRDRVKQVLSQLQIPGTLDELGIGALRDGFSDFLFPGFSTIQTRAKYLITVPRILRDFDKDKHKSLEKYFCLSYLPPLVWLQPSTRLLDPKENPSGL